jgi:apolipoprotein N-acyltransferase
MAATAMLPSRTSVARTPRQVTPQQIISSARAAPAGMRGALVVSCLSSVLLWFSFTPVDFGPLAWVAPVPLLLLIRLAQPTRWMYRCAYFGGLLFWVPTLQWMRLGDITMYPAWLALAFYLALYFPAFLALTRLAVWQFRVPMMLAAPVVWTGLELLRGHLMTGFSWYYLGHTQYRWIELIQISDLVGAYGVSFVVMLGAACVAELLPAHLCLRLGMLPANAAAPALPLLVPAGRRLRIALCLAIVAGAAGYGYARRHGVEFQPGPRVALVQGNVTSSVKHDPRDWPLIHRTHQQLTGIAVKQQPDLIVWPETMFRYPLLESPAGISDEQLQAAHPSLPIATMRDWKVRDELARMAQMAGAAMVIGLETRDIDLEAERIYNSAVLVQPWGALAGRYDKLHRVPFGEYLPLADTAPWLAHLTPFPKGFGIKAGHSAMAFEHKGFRFAPIICFEDTVPHLVRSIINVTSQPGNLAGPAAETASRKIDFLVNLTNDGWFHGSSELDQHLITAAFRSVECRTPMVRAVNTGISAFIDGDGVIRRRAVGLGTGRAKQDEAVLVDVVPLDARQSLYLAGGDWFSGGCLACCGFLSLMGLGKRWSERRRSAKARLSATHALRDAKDSGG